MSGHRIQRLQSLFKHEISLLIQNELKDPRIKGIVSITYIKLAKDIKNALIFISIMNNDEGKLEVIEGLNSSSSFIRKRLGKLLTLKYIPRITFKLDESVEKGSEMYFKLKDMEERERELGWYDNENELEQ